MTKRVLAITTSAAPEICLLHDQQLTAESGKGQALESIVPALERVLAGSHVGLDQVGLIAVCVGPGSFTGLRIGVTFAKCLAQSRNIPITGISAYDVAAFGNECYPVIAVVRGKPDYYYARVTRNKHDPAEFIAGDRASVERVAARVGAEMGTMPLQLGNDFLSYAEGDLARRVALLGQQAHAAGLAASWRDITIDYGQRPNAVINWEQHQERT